LNTGIIGTEKREGNPAVPRNRRNPSWLYFGALQGALAWTSYAIIECWFVTIVPFIFPHGPFPKLYHWGFTLILFLIYALVGMMLGGLIGRIAQFFIERRLSLARVGAHVFLSFLATSSIVVLYFINLVTRFKMGPSSVALSVLSLVLLAILVMSTFGAKAWNKKLGFLNQPATVSAILLGESSIFLIPLGNHGSRIIKAGASLLYLVGVVLISYTVDRYLKINEVRRPNISGPVSRRRGMVVLTTVSFITIALSAGINRPRGPIPSGVTRSPSKAGSPNIVLVVMDTVRADHLSIYGYERDTTPNIKNLASEATLYPRAISSSDLTLSTHASLFTGMYPRRHGAYMKPPEYPYGRPLSKDFDTLAEVLSREGYSTFAVVSNYHAMAPEFGVAQGFQYYNCRQTTRFLEQGPITFFRAEVYLLLKELCPRVASDKLYRNAEEINADVFKLLDNSLKAQRPFFLFINYMDAHVPYLPPRPFDTLYPGKINSFTSKDENEIEADVMKLKRDITDRARRHFISQYDGAIAYLDLQISKLVERLKLHDLYDKSLIIITSDHGESFGEKNFTCHGNSVYQNQVHVPLVIKYPGQVQGKTVNQLVNSVDIMPTILDKLGLKVPDGTQGQSLLGSASTQDRIVLAVSYPDAGLLQWHPRFHRIQRALFFGNLKLIVSTNGEVELYDLMEDPNEERNLYGQEPESRKLKKMLDQWLRDVEEAPNPRVGKETAERLKSLGYVGKYK
jgi:arylsulfatase A-like enzyme